MGRGLAVVVLWGALGCSYSPPIRGLHPGMPGRLVRGQLEIGGDLGGAGFRSGGVTAPTTGGPHVAYGLSDTLVVEGGANLNFFEGAWATAYAGVRLSRSKPLPNGLQLVGELEAGAGLGIGGRTRDASAPSWASPSYGLYEGFGLGLRGKWLGAYLRGRLDASASTTAPATLWPTLMVGLEARAGSHVAFGLGTGLGGYWNERDALVGLWFYEAQVALLFDLLPSK